MNEKIQDVVSGVIGNYPELLATINEVSDNCFGIRKNVVSVFSYERVSIERIEEAVSSLISILKAKGFSVGEMFIDKDDDRSFMCNSLSSVEKAFSVLKVVEESQDGFVALPLSGI